MSVVRVEVKISLDELNKLVMEAMQAKFGEIATISEVTVFEGRIVVARFGDEAVTYNSNTD